jgi:signal transduction histidine kinase
MPLLERRLVEEDQELRTAMVVARKWNTKLTAGGLVVTLTLLAGGVGAWLLIASRFSRGLRALAGHVRLLRAGEPVPPVRVRPGDELSELASAFNEMAAALQGQRQTRFRVLASVAHDLRNPLQALKLLSEDVADYIQAEDAQRAMNVVRRQVGRMERLVTDLMDAAKIEAGDLELHMGPCDLVGLARESVELYDATAPRHQVALKAPARPVFVRCDSTRIAQVLNNLVSNAIKYSPSGGPVEVIVEDDEGACVTVADHGVGISPEDRTRIFEPFERLSSTVDLAAGAGLGLAIAKRIVAAHQGELSVESTVGGGSTFRVRFR